MIKAERVFLIDTCYTYAEETFSTREHNNVAVGDNNVRKNIKYSSLNGWAFLLMGLCLLVYSIHIGDLLFMQHFLYHALHQRVVMGHNKNCHIKKNVGVLSYLLNLTSTNI